jgi:hypothetical protein
VLSIFQLSCRTQQQYIALQIFHLNTGPNIEFTLVSISTFAWSELVVFVKIKEFLNLCEVCCSKKKTEKMSDYS